ncbi:AraC-like DNA-binding protein [Larkinella arboricola]|uniref:AraC-like DNA-binding protein n=1 Tax=Larkinella arboricola TaxID=643671 RepID=A0A327WXD1_LARAB|nr:AraC family transcriptional regulator [Larkinella arboricola]RAJ97829.1 AraC-like DNA-binding protein [Larkinella arboricola]
MNTTSFEELCLRLSTGSSKDLSALLPSGIQQEVGHFNVFNLTDFAQTTRDKAITPYPCRVFYKISLLTGPSTAEYPDGTIEITQPALIFSTPKVPFYWLPKGRQTGQFCVFTAEFLQPTKSGVMLDELPIFKMSGNRVFFLSEMSSNRVQAIFEQMQDEIASDYAYKYDLLRTYTLELIHLGQKLQSTSALHPNHTASARMTSLFIELLERQFPIETPQQQMRLRTAKDYADQLAVHVNHLNKILKETTGLTTTDLISGRIIQEAKILLRQTDWTIAEIADSLGFADVAHFAKFFKRETSFAPGAFRLQTPSLNYT